MSDTENNPLIPADPPDTQPPGTGTSSSAEADEPTTDAKPADPPDTQPPGS